MSHYYAYSYRAVISPTFIFQKVRSLWQSEVQIILIRTSQALGGATSTSSITSGSPAALLTAAVELPRAPTRNLINNVIKATKAGFDLSIVNLPLQRMGLRLPLFSIWFARVRVTASSGLGRRGFMWGGCGLVWLPSTLPLVVVRRATEPWGALGVEPDWGVRWGWGYRWDDRWSGRIGFDLVVDRLLYPLTE